MWYIKSESRLKAQTKKVFDSFDANGNGKVEVAEVRAMVSKLAEGNPKLQGEVEAAVQDFQTHLSAGQDDCDYAAFQAWCRGRADARLDRRVSFSDESKSLGLPSTRVEETASTRVTSTHV